MKRYITYEEPLKNRSFTEKQMKELYRDLADKKEYPTFDIWFDDMLKSGVFEEEPETEEDEEIMPDNIDDLMTYNGVSWHDFI